MCRFGHNVIEELWHGDLKATEREYANPRDESQAAKAEEKLVKALNDERREMLETLMEHLTLTADLECDAFTRGDGIRKKAD